MIFKKKKYKGLFLALILKINKQIKLFQILIIKIIKKMMKTKTLLQKLIILFKRILKKFNKNKIEINDFEISNTAPNNPSTLTWVCKFALLNPMIFKRNDTLFPGG